MKIYKKDIINKELKKIANKSVDSEFPNVKEELEGEFLFFNKKEN